VEVLVDTGATYTVLPRGLLEKLEITPHAHGRFEIADGSVVELDIGRAWVRLDGHEEFTLVVFGDDALLGAVTLEEMHLAPTLRDGGC
jgi:aspartyl protease family protein